MTEDPRGGCSPCFAADLVAGQPVDTETRRDVARFRKAERTRLLTLRQALPQAERQAQAAKIASALHQEIKPGPEHVIACYWPIRSELDLRPWMAEAHAAGATLALPAVLEPGTPLAFHRWAPGAPMKRGFWNIPVPAAEEVVVPNVVISPVVGIDEEGYRLGNGGGYYDRTLAAIQHKPLVIGIGQDFTPIKTIFPMPWDLPMDLVILGDGSRRQIST
ncbi:hypothetical protein RSK20926_21380 [Roseobacter sp. SK209-2-6]|uniref:5-formyltetrahydrofolate cyclo-ligase n=1 Tax=Roseobacter sp. SK209-2-6 TaxID=388739 RepID=UPI0000F3E7A7|nr:5-formyltetrahydrofolate cyclo-ligase [Roseobacter sp. SK209-2-6]EBA16320.1 hypothetical protein RSK20926_21380 [Roseobacter sp. SK209-2-6]